MDFSSLFRKKPKQPELTAAQDFVNVRDIAGGKLYTKDGFVFMYLHITPVNIDLKTFREKQTLSRQLTAEFAGERKPFKIIAVSRPLDLSPIIDELAEYSKATDDIIKKDVIRRETRDISLCMLDGLAVTRRFFLALWELEADERELARRAAETSERFAHCKIHAETLRDEEIVQLCHVLAGRKATGINTRDVLSVLPRTRRT